MIAFTNSLSLNLSVRLGAQALAVEAAPPEPGIYNYLRPGGVFTYFRPDGTSVYKRPI